MAELLIDIPNIEERILKLGVIEDAKLDTKLAYEYTLEEIQKWCNIVKNTFPENILNGYYYIQVELFENANFLNYLKNIFDEDVQIKMPILDRLIAYLKEKDKVITGYPVTLLKYITDFSTDYINNDLNISLSYSFLEICKEQSCELWELIANNIVSLLKKLMPCESFNRHEFIIEISNFIELQRSMFYEDFISEHLCNRMSFQNFKEICFMCEQDKNMMDILRFTSSNGISFAWNKDYLQSIFDNGNSCIIIEKFTQIFRNFEAKERVNSMSKFLNYWILFGLDCEDVINFCDEGSNLVKLNEGTCCVDLISPISYWNMIKGNYYPRLSEIPEMNDDKFKRHAGLLVFAFRNNKNIFLNMVSEHINEFLSFKKFSILLDETIFDFFNLDSFNFDEISELGILVRNYNQSDFKIDYIYSFREIKYLFGSKTDMLDFYHVLDISDEKERLFTINEIRDYLEFPYEDDDLDELIKHLSIKSISKWMADDFGGICNLSISTAIGLLQIYSRCKSLVQQIGLESEASFVVRNRESILENQVLPTLTYIAENAMEFDIAWASLRVYLDIADDFINQNKIKLNLFCYRNFSKLIYDYYVKHEHDNYNRVGSDYFVLIKTLLEMYCCQGL